MEWRLLCTGAGEPAWNMAVDEAIMAGCARGDSPSTLRLYTWDPAAVSLGYAQSTEREIDREACTRLGVGLVRRITGGRAVLHGNDVTYSIIAPAGLLPGGVLELYRRLAAGIAAGLGRLGVAAELVGRPDTFGDRSPGGAPCFLAPSRWEITAGGRKLVGSAQARRRGAVLQHGSIPLRDDRERFCALLVGDAQRRSHVLSVLSRRATSLTEVLGRTPSADEVAGALTAGLEEVLGIVKPAPLTAAEEAEAGRLAREKYASPAWNEGRATSSGRYAAFGKSGNPVPEAPPAGTGRITSNRRRSGKKSITGTSIRGGISANDHRDRYRIGDGQPAGDGSRYSSTDPFGGAAPE